MPESEEQVNIAIPKEYVKVGGIILAALVILIVITVGAYAYAKKRTGTTILPGGSTYLGPTVSPAPQVVSSVISVPIDAPAQIWKGQKYPYSFSYPTGLSLGFFPGDPFDAVTVFWGNTNPSENIFIRVEDLNVIAEGKNFISKSKKEYANMWWKQYNWKGVSEIIEFTNTKGLKGYRAKYVDTAGQTPFDNVFFEVPGRRDLVVWIGGAKLDKPLFDRIVDTFGWGEQTPTQ